MKKGYSKILFPAVLIALFATLFTSCVDDDDNWPYNPPPGWSNVFYDQDLIGTWELVQANSMPVSTYETNFMEFYGSGRGRYYYYDRGALYGETMAYFCQYSGNTTTNYQVNVQYANGQSTTMTYWFTDDYDTLWLQWQVGGRTQTYLYQRVYRIP